MTVKNATLQDSLDQFVKGELLEGSNAYFCEKCGVKVRCYICMLLNMLLLHQSVSCSKSLCHILAMSAVPSLVVYFVLNSVVLLEPCILT